MNKTLIVMLLLILNGLPAWACTGCAGRFPPGVNIRLLKLKYDTDISEDNRLRKTLPPAPPAATTPVTATPKTSKIEQKPAQPIKKPDVRRTQKDSGR